MHLGVALDRCGDEVENHDKVVIVSLHLKAEAAPLLLQLDRARHDVLVSIELTGDTLGNPAGRILQADNRDRSTGANLDGVVVQLDVLTLML